MATLLFVALGKTFSTFFKSCGGQKKGKFLKKVAVGAPAKVCLGQNLDFVRRSVIPKSLKIDTKHAREQGSRPQMTRECWICLVLLKISLGSK